MAGCWPVNEAAELPQEATQKAFAQLLGVSEPMVVKHKQSGRLVMAGKLVRVAESIARIHAWKNPARGGDRTGKVQAHSPMAAAVAQALHPAPTSSGNADKSNYNLQAAREKLAAAQLRELELAREAGDLVLAAAVEALVFDQARQAREALMSIPDRVATILAAETDPAVVYARLTTECRKVCDQLAAGHASPQPMAAAA